ncbi:MAG: hypothetical protein IJA14_00110 [Alphaproteobacteria bacterium]|nr:hypothetical protein [Alphaproteobacteria bacterium]
MYSTMKLLPLILLVACSQIDDTTKLQRMPPKKISTTQSQLKILKILAHEKAENSVVLLVPLSGANKALGQDILNACLLDNNDSHTDFYVLDSESEDFENLQTKFPNLRAVIGPVFSHETHRFSTMFPQVPIFSLSNNADISNTHVFACGISPQDELKAMFTFAKNFRKQGLIIILPEDDQNNQLVQLIQRHANLAGFSEESIMSIKFNTKEMNSICDFLRANQNQIIFSMVPTCNFEQCVEDVPIFAFSAQVLSNPKIWNNAIFAQPETESQKEFVDKYKAAYGETPSIIAIIAKDLMNAINESYPNSKELLDETYHGMLGEFKFVNNQGVVRNFSLFRMEDGEKVRAYDD